MGAGVVPGDERRSCPPSLSRWLSERSAQRDLDLLHAPHLARLRSAGEQLRVEAGTRLCTAGEHVDHILVVTAGAVDLLARRPGGGRGAMAVVRPGGVIADIPVLLGSPMPFDAVASRRTDVVRLSQEQWVTVLGSSPALSFRWMASIARRLDSDRRRLAMMTRPLEAQVAYLLVQHREDRPDGTCEARLSHDVMAQLLGARRPSVSRVVGALHRRGLTGSGYGRVRLLDVDGLRELAGPEPLP